MLYDPKDYLKHILDEMDVIMTITENKEQDKFINDLTATRAAFACLTIIGEATKQLDKSFTDLYPDVPWSYMAKMRDKLIHSYMDVDYRLMWDTMTNDIPNARLQIINIINSI